MTKNASDLWGRSIDSLCVAEREVKFSPDNSAMCAYYAAFNAIGALLAKSGKEFRSHDGVEILLHKEFIKPGILPPEIGKQFKLLRDSRRVGSYGGGDHVLYNDAVESLESAKKIIEAVYRLHPGDFSMPEWVGKD